MTKAPKNLHENWVAITFLIRNMSKHWLLQRKSYQMFDSFGAIREERGSSSIYSTWGQPQNKPIINDNASKINKENLIFNAEKLYQKWKSWAGWKILCVCQNDFLYHLWKCNYPWYAIIHNMVQEQGISGKSIGRWGFVFGLRALTQPCL